MKETFIEVPKRLDRTLLIEEFGVGSVTYYETRLNERELYNGKKYLNPLKTIWIWASEDKKTNRGFYSTVPVGISGRKKKNHGRT